MPADINRSRILRSVVARDPPYVRNAPGLRVSTNDNVDILEQFKAGTRELGRIGYAQSPYREETRPLRARLSNLAPDNLRQWAPRKNQYIVGAASQPSIEDDRIDGYVIPDPARLLESGPFNSRDMWLYAREGNSAEIRAARTFSKYGDDIQPPGVAGRTVPKWFATFNNYDVPYGIMPQITGAVFTRF